MYIYVEAAISLSYKNDSISAGNKIRKKKIQCETIITQESLLDTFKLSIAV